MKSKRNSSIETVLLQLQEKLEGVSKELSEKKREIEVEKALDKVRTKAMNMRNSSELSETSLVLFHQLKELNIDAIRTGVGIFDDENDAIELWVTSVDEEGQLYFILDYINIHVHPVFENIVDARKNQQPYAFTRLEGEKLIQYYNTMSSNAGIRPQKLGRSRDYFYSFFFSAGMLNVVTKDELNQEELNIMVRLTHVFGLIYTRFLDLKKMEEQAAQIIEEKRVLEQTLANLRNAQSQLIQSEKMASLGELTAGIAHEIQNPLNFVNNFSEVNKELLAEMEEAVRNGNLEEAITLAKNISTNQEKINHHGKRAEGIVKGMLQHSRGSSGQKELTDINALCNEYLRLSYHGYRAKDKSFNAKFEIDFDESLPKINIVPQDIGRVVLNLINNAFYAVNQQRTRLPDGQATNNNAYEPMVTIATKKLSDKIEIRVEDNGLGIPENIKEKIFQPFFTTKPTGQGTGLGLSLSYDIVKAHGGDIKVETKEGTGSEFMISLPT